MPAYAGISINRTEMTMPRAARFWDRIAEGYAKQPVPDETIYQRKLQITRGYLRPDMTVLEFGCGTGSTALAHAPFVDHILALDISSKMIEIAQHKSETSNIGNVTFLQSGIEEFSEPDGSFDVIIGLSILHLLENRKEAIAKVYKLLKPGGVFVSSTACISSMMPVASFPFRLALPAGRLLGLLPLVKIFSVKELVGDLTEAGFAIEHQWQPGKRQAVFIVASKAK